MANNVKPDTFCQAVFSERHKLDASKAGILAKFLQPLLLHHTIPSLLPCNKLNGIGAKIREPTGGSDNPLRFTAGLVLAVNIDCLLDNVQDLNQVKIKVSSSNKLLLYYDAWFFAIT